MDFHGLKTLRWNQWSVLLTGMSDRLNEDVERCKDQHEDLNSSHPNRLLSPSETCCKFLFYFVLFLIFNINSFAKAQNNVINFNEEFKESSYQLNAEFYADPDFNLLLPENYNFTTADIIYIQVKNIKTSFVLFY